MASTDGNERFDGKVAFVTGGQRHRPRWASWPTRSGALTSPSITREPSKSPRSWPR